MSIMLTRNQLTSTGHCMNDNMYSTPESAGNESADRRGSPVKAVVVGVFTDIGGTMVFVIIVGIVVAVYMSSQGASQAEIEESFSGLSLTSGLGLFMAASGLLFSVLGGFVCARIARHNELVLGAAVGAVSSSLGVLLGNQAESTMESVVLAVLTCAAALAGAAIFLMAKR